MDAVSGFLIYICIWVVVLFMLLPIGVKTVENPEQGWDHGAPQKTLIGRKLLFTTCASALIWGVVYWYLTDIVKWGTE